MESNKETIDNIRLIVLTCAELFDAWRVVPRLLVTAYGWLCWQIVLWYTNLVPGVIEGCNIDLYGELCLYDAPTTQHAALVTVIVGASAAVFGLYANTGRSWAKGGFVKWSDTNTQHTGNTYKKSPYPENSINSDAAKQNVDYVLEEVKSQESDDFWDDTNAKD